ncbi:MAG: hypothetical protein KGM18_00615 [Sphingomonadales bacterium]|nr:hypothetical protein [Sphingomonadales bacterium]
MTDLAHCGTYSSTLVTSHGKPKSALSGNQQMHMKKIATSTWAGQACIGISLAALAGGAAASPESADRAGARSFTSAQIGQLLATPSRGTVSATLPTGAGGPTIMVVRRTASGEPEIHERFDDIFVVRSGRARVTVGGTITRNRMTSPGEARGGTISGGEQIEIGVGDVLWIPAGKPHQVILPDGGEVSYVVVKRMKLEHPAP